MKYLLIVFFLLIAGNSYSQKKAGYIDVQLTASEISEIRDQAIEDISNLERYVSKIVDKQDNFLDRYKAIQTALTLFQSDKNTFEYSSLEVEGAVHLTTIRSYLTRLLLLPYKSIKVQFYRIYLGQKFVEGRDGKYYGTVVFLERDEMGTNIETGNYRVIFKKRLQFIIDVIQLKSKDRTIKKWILKLGDISTEATSASSNQITKQANVDKEITPLNIFRKYFSDTSFSSEIDSSSRNINHSISYDNVNFKGNVNFRNTTFNIDIIPDKYLFFYKNIFWGKTYFTNTHFNCPVDFHQVWFKQDLMFDKSIFENPVSFSNNKFTAGANFKEVIFQNECYFLNDIFADSISFSGTKFNKMADFSGSIFAKIANFSSLIVGDSTKIIFNGAKLPMLTNFSNNPQILKEIDFTKANFDDYKSYSVTSRNWHYINAYNTDVSKIKLDYQHFRLCFYNSQLPDREIKFDQENHSIVIGNDTIFLSDRNLYGHLLANKSFQNYILQIFPSCKYPLATSFKSTLIYKANYFWSGSPSHINDSVIIEFLTLCLQGGNFPKRLSDEDISSIYEKILKNFESQGQRESYELLDVEYKDFKNGGSFFSQLPHLWNSYGYHKEWVFSWALILLSFFTVCTFFLIEFLHTNVYEVAFIKYSDIKLLREKNSLKKIFRRQEFSNILSQAVNRVWLSFLYTSVIFFLFSMKIESFKFKLKFSPIIGTLYVIIMYSTGIACLAYMANFVLQK